jgi:triosephosphate isomerase
MTRSNRRPLIGGNWKMNMLQAEAEELCQQLVAGIGDLEPETVIFPPFPLLGLVSRALDESPIACGAQDLHTEEKGAHTGDVSGPQIVDAGCTWVLCGHSERRQDHGENDAMVGEKAVAANRDGLIPLICVGETLEERKLNRTFDVLDRQLTAALRARPEPFALAYEPVWAIGTGETATAEIAQEAHKFLRDLLADLVGEETAAVKRILYGGSANPDNAASLFAEPDIDGFLVGGASLDANKFLAIIRSCSSA